MLIYVTNVLSQIRIFSPITSHNVKFSFYLVLLTHHVSVWDHFINHKLINLPLRVCQHLGKYSEKLSTCGGIHHPMSLSELERGHFPMVENTCLIISLDMLIKAEIFELGFFLCCILGTLSIHKHGRGRRGESLWFLPNASIHKATCHL